MAVLALLLLAGCGGAPGSDPGSNPGEGPTGFDRTVTTDVTGYGTIIQVRGEPAYLCSGVMESFPPQCAGGVALSGFDWDQLQDYDSESGVTWGDAVIVGRYTGQELVVSQAHQDFPEPPDQDWTFEQLCEDPNPDGATWDVSPEVFQDEQQNAIERARALTDIQGVWVSGQTSRYVLNVAVTGEAGSAEEAIRADAYYGPLCVAQVDGPTYAQLIQAQELVVEALDTMTYSSVDEYRGRLEVGVLVADTETVQEVLTAIDGVIAPEYVSVEGFLRPVTLEGDGED